VTRLLEKDPAARFASGADTLKALSGVRDPSRTVTFHRGSGPSGHDFERDGSTLPALPPPPRKRRITPARALVGGAILLAAMLVGFAAVKLLARSPYPGRRTPEDVIETLHLAIERRDYPAFAACFEPEALLEYLSDEPEEVFRERTKGIVDFAYKSEVPDRGPGREDVSLRVVSGTAMRLALDRPTRQSLLVALRHEEGGFLVARVFEEPGLPRRNLLPELMKRERRLLDAKVEEIVGSPGEQGPKWIERMARERRMPEKKLRTLKERLARLAATKKKIEYRILHDESSYDFRRAVVALECRDLAGAFGLEGDRIQIEFRRGRDRSWQAVRIRPAGKGR